MYDECNMNTDIAQIARLNIKDLSLKTNVNMGGVSIRLTTFHQKM